MPQISLYIDKDTLLKIEKAAKQENISLYKWVGKNIKKAIQEDYPPKYFELFGAIVDESFTVPSSHSKKIGSENNFEFFS